MFPAGEGHAVWSSGLVPKPDDLYAVSVFGPTQIVFFEYGGDFNAALVDADHDFRTVETVGGALDDQASYVECRGPCHTIMDPRYQAKMNLVVGLLRSGRAVDWTKFASTTPAEKTPAHHFLVHAPRENGHRVAETRRTTIDNRVAWRTLFDGNSDGKTDGPTDGAVYVFEAVAGGPAKPTVIVAHVPNSALTYLEPQLRAGAVVSPPPDASKMSLRDLYQLFMTDDRFRRFFRPTYHQTCPPRHAVTLGYVLVPWGGQDDRGVLLFNAARSEALTVYEKGGAMVDHISDRGVGSDIDWDGDGKIDRGDAKRQGDYDAVLKWAREFAAHPEKYNVPTCTPTTGI